MDKKWWTLVAVCAGVFMLLLDVTIVIVAQPSIQAGLHAGFSDVQWTLDAYALTLASLLLTSGVLADRYGRKLLFTIGLAIFTLGSLLCGLAVNPLMLILSRCGQGVGGAMVFATSLALLGQTYRGRDRGVAFGVWGAIIGISTALGPVLGGMITTEWDWRGIFLVNVPVGVFAIAVTVLRVDRIALAAARAAGLGRVRAVHRRARQPHLRADPGRGELLVRRRGDRLPGRRRGPADRVRRDGEPGRAPHVRPVAAARPDVQRRRHRGVRDERVAVRDAAVLRDLPAGCARLLGARRRAADRRASARRSWSPR